MIGEPGRPRVAGIRRSPGWLATLSLTAPPPFSPRPHLTVHCSSAGRARQRNQKMDLKIRCENHEDVSFLHFDEFRVRGVGGSFLKHYQLIGPLITGPAENHFRSDYRFQGSGPLNGSDVCRLNSSSKQAAPGDHLP